MTKDFREPEDFLTDESFLSWYFKSGKGETSSWDRWIAEDPNNLELVNRAVILLDSTRLKEKEWPAAKVQEAEKALMEKIGTGGAVRRRLDWKWAAAACVLLVMGAGMVMVHLRPSRPQLVTQYGQLSVQLLPDGSEVTMNANSRLRYFNAWNDGTDREVWIDGEAFFHVSKTRLKSRFIVHTDRFDIVVTGTQFNVVNRRGNANVMLREGSVILHTREGEEMRMAPGDFVEWDREQLKKNVIKSDSLLAWKEHKLIFDKTPLRDVVRIIEDQYGVPVVLQDQSIADSTITGIMQNNNLDVLLQALESTSDFDVDRSNGTITIKSSSH